MVINQTVCENWATSSATGSARHEVELDALFDLNAIGGGDNGSGVREHPLPRPGTASAGWSPTLSDVCLDATEVAHLGCP